MIQRTVCADLENGIHRARSQLRRAINQMFNTRINHGSGAHSTWLNRYVKRGIGQTIIAYLFRRRAQRQNLSMRGRIITPNRLVMPASNNLLVNYHHGTDWNFTNVSRLPGFSQSKTHKKLIQGIRVLKEIY